MKKRRGRPKKAAAEKPSPVPPVVTAEEEVVVEPVEQNVDEIGVPDEGNENGGGQFEAAKEFSSSMSGTSSSSDGGSFGEDSDSFEEPVTSGRVTMSVNKHGRPQLIREESPVTPPMSLRGLSRPKLPSVKKPRQDPRYNKAELVACLEVIQKITQMEEAVSFCSPIDPISQGIPDYFSVIDTPMDFGTIHNNLLNDVKYVNSDDVLKDVDIIWDNCSKYNKKGDYIVYLMRRVKKKFMKYWTEAGLRTEMQRMHYAPPSVHTMRQSPHEAMFMVDNMVNSYQSQPRVHKPSYAHPYMSHQPQPGPSLVPPYSQFHPGVGRKSTGHSYRQGPTYSKQQQPQLSSRYKWQSHHTTSQPQPAQSHFRTDTNNTVRQQSVHPTDDDGVTHNGPNSSTDPIISSKGHTERKHKRKHKRKHHSSSHHEHERPKLPQPSSVLRQLSRSAASADLVSPGSNEIEGSRRRVRGRTKMADVHARRFEERKLIPLNDQFQPVSSDPKLISEFSRFLGTLARQFVPLTYVSWHKVPEKANLWAYVKEKYIIAEEGKAWVLRTLRESWKSYKSRVKKNHYVCYDNDDERIKNKPSDVPLEEFKALLAYWGNSKVKETAERNSESRRKIVETHTAGSRSFAQISMEMQLENGKEPSKAELYIATRKRKDGQEYKSPTDMIKNKISTLQEMCSSGADRENVEQIVAGDTPRWDSWLVGRSGVRKRKSSTKVVEETSGDLELELLTEGIKKNLQSQMEETINKKVEEKMALLMKKLAESNPGLALNAVEHQSSSEHDGSSENDDVSS